ncbi:unnamed protein product [Albugo candida]|nr:unnamed protein product [Albugo candida]|eukprot:CCI47281.1 unnamed protein product [Albugo candida]
MKSVKHVEWKEAADAELASMEENRTWTIVPRTNDIKALHTKWVFKRKTDANGNLERFKARMVACGNKQVLGVNYDMTVAAVMDLGTAKLILALARIWGMPARHGDGPNAYVKAPTEKNLDLYLHVPQGMKISTSKLDELGVTSRDQVVLRLQKSLYGLKQAGRLWSHLLHEKLSDAGFKQSLTDSCLYYDQDTIGITVLGSFNRPVSKFLGMRVRYNDEDGYYLDQEPSICELMTKMGMDEAHPVLTPIGQDYSDSTTSNSEYLEIRLVKKATTLAGSLLWIARCTRPDISFAMHKLTRRTHAPTTADWASGVRVVKYLKGTKSLKLYLGGEVCTNSREVTLEAFSDADYAADDETRKSISGTAFTLNGMTISWSCKKQHSVALSTMEAEFVAASKTSQELLGAKKLFSELKAKVKEPMILWMDNQAAISQSLNEATSIKAEHIDVRLKFVRANMVRKIIAPRYVHTSKMMADL